ncbi:MULTISPECIES: DNA-directed RNA polymerase subunit alpha C-terminal domain-containing protein [unclassified Nonomuraea]|uniref:DNA-directed RNA polymerase subunit alpha C-terminal domain-containing protein n=1 Tax=unclassified Nonomuraea TaxID=2593643 RepID=UPI0033FB7D76
MPTNPNRTLTVTLTSDIWDHVTDLLGDFADQVEERPWLGDCLDCDKADPGMCPQHKQAAEFGTRVRGWRDQMVDQIVVQTATTADLVRYSWLPVTTKIDDLSVSGEIRNLLARAGIFTLGDLAAYSDDELRGLRNLGAGRFAELRTMLRGMAASG